MGRWVGKENLKQTIKFLQVHEHSCKPSLPNNAKRVHRSPQNGKRKAHLDLIEDDHGII